MRKLYDSSIFFKGVAKVYQQLKQGSYLTVLYYYIRLYSVSVIFQGD